MPCPGCGSLFPDQAGPTHRYFESSAGCWAAYGGVLARQYTDDAYAAAVQLTVDAYAVQHPGQPSPQSIQSIALHLISLCLILERNVGRAAAIEAMQKAAENKARFFWLTPPPPGGLITVATVHAAQSAAAHVELVREWAASAWLAWSAHHATIRRWLPDGF